MTKTRFSQFQIGDELPGVEQVVAQDVIDRYAVASLDYNPVHTNIEWCTRAQVFGLPVTVGHGMFTMSLMASVAVRAFAGGSARIRTVEAKFTKPVPVGSTLRCSGKVKELHPIGPGRNFVTVELAAHNPAGEVMGIGTAEVLLPD
jgi:acyl dehydratase